MSAIRNAFRLASNVVIASTHSPKERAAQMATAILNAAQAKVDGVSAMTAFMLAALEAYAGARSAKGTDHKAALDAFNVDVNAARDSIISALKNAKERRAFTELTRRERQEALKAGTLKGETARIARLLESSYPLSSYARSVLDCLDQYPEAIAPYVGQFLTLDKSGNRRATASDLYNASNALRMSKGKSAEPRKSAVKTPVQILRTTVESLVKINKLDLARAIVAVAAKYNVKGKFEVPDKTSK